MEWIYKNDFIKMDIYHSLLKIKKRKNSPALIYLFKASNGNNSNIFSQLKIFGVFHLKRCQFGSYNICRIFFKINNKDTMIT